MNSVKTATAGAAVAGVVLLFINPPVGVAVGISSAVAGLATTAGDSIATKYKRSRLGYKIAEVKTAAREMAEVFNYIRLMANIVAVEHAINEDQAWI